MYASHKKIKLVHEWPFRTRFDGVHAHWKAEILSKLQNILI